MLAIESRLLQARDIDTGEFLNIEMKVEVEDDDKDEHGKHNRTKIVEIQTPDIINGKIINIQIKNAKYHTVNISFRTES